MTPLIRLFIKAGFGLALALGLAACGRLPAGAPASSELIGVAANDEANGEFALYEVTRAFLPTVTKWPATDQNRQLRWIGSSHGPSTQIIRPGDSLGLHIWDSSENSLLTTAEQRMVDMAEMKVRPDGTIFVPYIGDVVVSGRTPGQARREIQEGLEVIVPSAQVQLSLVEGRANSVELIGGVASPGSYPMPDRNYSVMSLIAAGGGVSSSLENPQVRLVRGGAIYGTSVAKLLNEPQKDTRLRGGDKIFVEEDARYFLSLGATGSEDLHPFTREQVSAMDALAIIGGVNERYADPRGLLILREYPASAVAPGARGPLNTRVVFSVDLTNFDGLFSARKFQIQPGDVVLATESPVNDAVTVSNLIGNFFGIFNATGAI